MTLAEDVLEALLYDAHDADEEVTEAQDNLGEVEAMAVAAWKEYHDALAELDAADEV